MARLLVLQRRGRAGAVEEQAVGVRELHDGYAVASLQARVARYRTAPRGATSTVATPLP
jgi:hypothetical protein